jgi:serine/threonine protein kinase
MADRTGQHLGNYRLVRLLGQGGFAEVYLSEHIHLGTQTAIKLLHTQLAGEDTDAFRKEARTIARLVHPHIVRVFDFGIEGEMPFLVMDYAPNGTVRKRHPKGVALPLPTILGYVKQLADALQYAHDEHFIHRDIKPENLLVGRRQEILLSDFGIALLAQTSRSQSMQDVAGTASYMAPEQFQGKPRPASDQYALAVMVYEWLTGTCPFHGSFTEIASQHLFVPPPPLRGRTPTISPEVEQVVMTALAKDPKQRFGSVLAFATALEQASQAETSQTLPASQSLYPADAMPSLHLAQPPTEFATSLSESVIPTSLPTLSSQTEVPTELVTPPSQASLPPTELDPHVSQSTVLPTEVALPSQLSAASPAEMPPAGSLQVREEEQARKAEEETARQEKEQAANLEEERVRKAEDTALAATQLATAAHQTPLPTEVARSSKPPALQPGARMAVKPAKLGASRRFVLLVLAGLVIVALSSGIAWFTVHHGFSGTLSITEFPLPTGRGLGAITAGPDGNLWFT